MQNTGTVKFSSDCISIRIRYSTNSKVNIHIRRLQIFSHLVTSLVRHAIHQWITGYL